MSRSTPFASIAGGLTVENFDRRASAVLAGLDRDDVRIRFAFSRRRPSALARDPYRADVSRIPLMARQEELEFCMGMELLAMRLRNARHAAGVPEEGASRQQRARVHRAARDHELARNELVERNLYLVFRLLEKYRHVNVALEDMVQEANLSLFKAVENFDFRRGVLFKTYAGYWINQAFLNAIYNQSRTVRVPAYIQKAMKKLNDAASSLESGLTDVAAAAREANLDPELAATAVQGNRYTSSLNRTFDAAEGTEFVDMVEAVSSEPANDPEEAERMRQHLFEAVAHLSQREQDVLHMRYGLGGRAIATLAEVGRQLGISLERVRQIQAGALIKIRKGMNGPSLEQFA